VKAEIYLITNKNFQIVISNTRYISLAYYIKNDHALEFFGRGVILKHKVGEPSDEMLGRQILDYMKRQ